uniref:Solute carrier family 3 member 2 N-terminal domain-containing protein n=1 Tax=Zosterops lateralis melanops TaxID=1220523 RepID=A0A8D2PNW2_ZOSLA
PSAAPGGGVGVLKEFFCVFSPQMDPEAPRELELSALEAEKEPMAAGPEPGAPPDPIPPPDPRAGAEKNGLVMKIPPEEEEEAALSGAAPSGSPKFTGLGKEELLREAGTPLWSRARKVLLLLFWGGWLGMLGAAAAIVVQAPRCQPLPSKAWWELGALYRAPPKAFGGDLKVFGVFLGCWGLAVGFGVLGWALGQFWAVLGTLWCFWGGILRLWRVQGGFGVTPDPKFPHVFGYFGVILGPFWGHFGPLSPHINSNFSPFQPPAELELCMTFSPHQTLPNSLFSLFQPPAELELCTTVSSLRSRELSLLLGQTHPVPSVPPSLSLLRLWDQSERYLLLLNPHPGVLKPFSGLQQPPGGSQGPLVPPEVTLRFSTGPVVPGQLELRLEEIKVGPYDGMLLGFPYKG